MKKQLANVSCAGLCLLSVVSMTDAAVILNPGPLDSNLTVWAYRAADGPKDELFPTSAIYSNDHLVVYYGETSGASYDFNQERFTINFEHEGTNARYTFGGKNVQRDGCDSSASIRFGVDIETPYTITGIYRVAGDRRKFLTVALRTTSSMGYVFKSHQDSWNTTVENFVVGDLEGDTGNELIGDQSGILQPGLVYVFGYEARIENVFPPPGTAVGHGNVTLHFSVVPIPHVCLWDLDEPPDGDVDGIDLAIFNTSSFNENDLEGFAAEFGSINCYE